MNNPAFLTFPPLFSASRAPGFLSLSRPDSDGLLRLYTGESSVGQGGVRPSAPICPSVSLSVPPSFRQSLRPFIRPSEDYCSSSMTHR